MEIVLTINQVKNNLFDEKMLGLLVDDYEYGRAIASMDSIDEDKYFTLPKEEKAKIIAEHIRHITQNTLAWKIEEILGKNEKEE